MRNRSFFFAFLVVMCCFGFAGCGSEPALDGPADEGTPTELVLRQLPDKNSYGRLDRKTPVQRIVVKFHEGTRVRLRGAALRAELEARSLRERRTLRGLGISDERVLDDVTQANDLLGGGLRPTFAQDEEALASSRRAGEAAASRELADLSLYYNDDLPMEEGTTFEDVADRIDALNALDSVEIAYAQPPSEVAQVDIPPTTSSFEGEQGYLEAAPGGINARYAWTIPGGNAAGVRIIDVEGAWRTTHEDMPALFHEGGTQINDLSWRNHGTAVLGVMVGAKNAYGVSGIAWGAAAGYESIGAQSTASAISYAASAAGPGGVVLIELHAQGPSGTACSCNQSQCGYIAMEYWQAEFNAIANASANGVIVVEAAGNGSANLDDARYGGLFNRAVRDSGAILVGAGNGAGRVPTCWTNHGSRIDTFGWGEGVTTMGYGSRFNPGDENQYYTASFNGTSSASPVVVGAVASVQGVVLADGRPALNAWQIRDLLFRTGTPQASGAQYIGRMPNLLAAISDINVFENRWHLYPAGQNFGNPSPWEPITGDFNGDGKTDYGRLGGPLSLFFFSNGDGTFSALAQSYPAGVDYGNPSAWDTIVGDFNGDGKTDYGRVGATSTHLFYSQGNGAFAAQVQAHPSGWDFGLNLAWWPALVGDWSGDGKTDYLRLAGTYSHVFLAR